MSEWLTAGICNFCFIGLKAFQQRNVAFDHYTAVLPTSIIMAVFEVAVIAVVAKAAYNNFWVVALSVGVGGGLGALASMWIHKHIFEAVRRTK